MCNFYIVLIGSENVGKSTLFNKLTKTNDALVSDIPGWTRDIKYGDMYINNNKFIIIDTGKINSPDNNLDNEIIKKSIYAINKANIIFFILNAKNKLTSSDQNIYQLLKCYNIPIFFIINKIDGININLYINDFYLLGVKNFICISALYNIGINNLIKKIKLYIKKQYTLKKNILFKNIKFENINKLNNHYNKKIENININLIKIAIIGQPNVGKSTLVNTILNKNRIIVSNIPGTTRDNISLPFKYNKKKYILTDTSGIKYSTNNDNKQQKKIIKNTKKIIQKSDIILLIINIQNGIVNQDLHLINFIITSGQSLVISINKCDCISKKIKNKFKIDLLNRFKFLFFIKIIFISGLKKIGIKNLFHSINITYNSSIKKINNNLLNKAMYIAIKNFSPPFFLGKKIKFKYANFGGNRPIKIIIHGLKVQNCPYYYKKYLMNFFYKFFNIIGTKIYIYFRENYNPYINK